LVGGLEAGELVGGDAPGGWTGRGWGVARGGGDTLTESVGGDDAGGLHVGVGGGVEGDEAEPFGPDAKGDGAPKAGADPCLVPRTAGNGFPPPACDVGRERVYVVVALVQNLERACVATLAATLVATLRVAEEPVSGRVVPVVGDVLDAFGFAE
jgi:hypothetical protein